MMPYEILEEVYDYQQFVLAGPAFIFTDSYAEEWVMKCPKAGVYEPERCTE